MQLTVEGNADILCLSFFLLSCFPWVRIQVLQSGDGELVFKAVPGLGGEIFKMPHCFRVTVEQGVQIGVYHSHHLTGSICTNGRGMRRNIPLLHRIFRRKVMDCDPQDQDSGTSPMA